MGGRLILSVPSRSPRSPCCFVGGAAARAHAASHRQPWQEASWQRQKHRTIRLVPSKSKRLRAAPLSPQLLLPTPEKTPSLAGQADLLVVSRSSQLQHQGTPLLLGARRGT